MSLVVKIKSVEDLEGTADRSLRVVFRGQTKETRKVRSAKNAAYFGEVISWPLAKPADITEAIDIQLIVHNRYTPNKVVGHQKILMQSLIEYGDIKATEPLVDSNNRIRQENITYEIEYNSPDGAVGTWRDEEFAYPLTNGEDLEDIQENEEEEDDVFPRSASPIQTPSSKGMEANDEQLEETVSTPGDPSDNAEVPSPADVPIPKVLNTSDHPGETSNRKSIFAAGERLRPKPDFRVHELYKSTGNQRRHFKVCITIVEAQQLVGLDIDPVIRVEVGDLQKYTTIQKSTNSPCYNDSFVFEFHDIPALIFDRMIVITAMHALAIPGRQVLRAGNVLAGRVIGQFKCDVGTVYANPEHQFYHRWAILQDPRDIGESPRGYVKCDIAVIGRGDNLKTSKVVTEEESSNIEENLLLPVGTPAERQRAEYTVTIYRGEDIPQTDSGLVASVRKVFNNALDMVDAFVAVTFIGHVGKTSVKKSCNPYWGEVLTFVDMFPPLCNRMKIQLMDSDAMSEEVIATHFIELALIMDPGGDTEGHLPTMGPLWINLYGAPTEHSALNTYTHLDEGLAEGAAYRGRLLVAINTTLLDADSGGAATVNRDRLHSSAKVEVAPKKEFLLFTTLFSCTMIDRKYKGKSIHFEVTIGDWGCRRNQRGRSDPASNEKEAIAGGVEEVDGENEDEEALLLGTEQPQQNSNELPRNCTKPATPVTDDNCFYYINFAERKPCLSVASLFEDLRKRLYNATLLDNMSENLDAGMEDVKQSIHRDEENTHVQMKVVLSRFSFACGEYLSSVGFLGTGHGAGKTKLDRYRLKACRIRVEKLKSTAEKISASVNSENVANKFFQAKNLARRVRHLTKEPQHSLPDVFIWMMANKKRVAYHRIPAKKLLYADQEAFKGKHCGKKETIFLKTPEKMKSSGRTSIGASDGGRQAKLVMHMWIGINDFTGKYMSGLPPGLNAVREEGDSDKSPPSALIYKEKNVYHFRAYIAQARNLLGADDSGLSDPYARVTVATLCKTTQIRDQTLSPEWNETLDFDQVTLYGPACSLKKHPPVIMIEVFDHDILGKPEPLGQATVTPKVKLANEEYGPPNFPPKLAWWQIYYGKKKAGQLLGAFEVLQVQDEVREGLPLPPPKDANAKRLVYPLPPQIKLTASWFRIEVLFWGLRGMKKLHLMSVEKPRVYASCAGKMVQSRRLSKVDKNANFDQPVQYMDVRLPDNQHFWPPIVIRCMNHRQFVGETLVGACTIASERFLFIDKKKQTNVDDDDDKKIAEEPTTTPSPSPAPPPGQMSNGKVSPDHVVVDIEGGDRGESTGVLPHVEIVNPMHQVFTDTEIPKVEQEIKNKLAGKHDLIAALDWWSKYYATKNDIASSTSKNRRQFKSRARLSSSVTDWSSEDSSETESDEASSRHEADPVETPGNSKEEKKRRKKSGRRRRKTAAKKRMKKFLGHVNPAFKADDGDQIFYTASEKEEDDSYINRLKIYPTTLELVPEFNGFEEHIQSFDLYRGRKTEDDDDDLQRVVGKFKGAFCIYKIDDDNYGTLEGAFSADEVIGSLASQLVVAGGTGHVLPKKASKFHRAAKLKLPKVVPVQQTAEVHVVVYVIKALGLPPMDLNGKADPYLIVRLGKHEINDKELAQQNQLNPVFGRVYEYDITFPLACYLHVQVMDHDRLSADDLIGETVIDLENRFLSKHRATCGISQQYDTYNYNVWRDPTKPAEILAKLCRENQIDQPVYAGQQVEIAGRVYHALDNVETVEGEVRRSNENLALEVLKHWGDLPGCYPLVPEHIETRPLYCPTRPGVEQGKVEMWVDMFPKEMGMPSVTVDITPRQPKRYELRCIVWNTDDVVLDDKNVITGEESSDILVKGYLFGPDDDGQATDIHYRSLTGEGNFNWRFIFPFDYLRAEEKMVLKKKVGIFDLSKTEVKMPPKLTIQVWDADLVSADDFLGSLVMDLNRIPKPAKDPKGCVLRRPKANGPVPTFSLFKNKRCRGWWPVSAREANDCKMVGKVELEMHLLPEDEAEKHPIGKGRDGLSEPNRPDTSFLWFMNPLKTLRYIFWKNFKYKILKVFLFICLVIFLGLFLYNMPGATVNKIWSV